MNNINITEKALAVVNQLKKEYQNLIFHHCICENNNEGPILILKEEMYLDDHEILLGTISGIDYYINIIQYSIWKNTPLMIDIIQGEGSTFSLEYISGIRFIANAKKVGVRKVLIWFRSMVPNSHKLSCRHSSCRVFSSVG